MEMGGTRGKIIRRAMDDKGDKMERPKRKTIQRQTAQEMEGRHYRNGWTKLNAGMKESGDDARGTYIWMLRSQ
ncbi:hypothetical protein EVAR_11837_1 [Eumeta japonica]|uniref:Uncharacterized protein n=1 Tax=Eumeta variegata TaxID=151549 RepID=A0A4C1YNP5_EUMVA|nr:hypothetical protein EVAR_11837_1 [Eumeta japonica]